MIQQLVNRNWFGDWSETVSNEHQAWPPEVVEIPVDDGTLMGELAILAHALGIVLFAHGSGSSRHSSRNRRVAEVLRESQIGTLNELLFHK